MGCANTKSVKTESGDKPEVPAGKQEAAVRPLTPTGDGAAENGGEPQKDAVTGEEVQKVGEEDGQAQQEASADGDAGTTE